MAKVIQPNNKHAWFSLCCQPERARQLLHDPKVIALGAKEMNNLALTVFRYYYNSSRTVAHTAEHFGISEALCNTLLQTAWNAQVRRYNSTLRGSNPAPNVPTQ